MRTLQSQCQYARVGGGVSGPARASTRSWENFYVKTFPMSSGRRNEVWDLGGGIGGREGWENERLLWLDFHCCEVKMLEVDLSRHTMWL